MLRLPKLILCEIGYYLPLPDLTNMRLTNNKFNSCFELDYFWQQRIKFDFSYRTGYENNLKLYRELYLGQKLICQNQIMTEAEFDKQKSSIMDNGKVVIFLHNFNYIYLDDWNKHNEYLVEQLRLGANSTLRGTLEAPANKICLLSVPGNKYIYYISPNKVRKFIRDFKIGYRYGWRSLPTYRKITKDL